MAMREIANARCRTRQNLTATIDKKCDRRNLQPASYNTHVGGTDRSLVEERIRKRLAESATATGGWPYAAGKASRVEPTCWALLALLESSGSDPSARAAIAGPHVAWLARAQRADGLLADQSGVPANFTANGLAACVLASSGTWRPASAGPTPDLSKLLSALISAKGVSVDGADARQDNRLQGWPWLADTFSWLEPTAWCVLGLKKAGAQAAGAAARIQEAEQLILNRACESGGWNFGNAAVTGQDLRPYVPTTALALIAMQDRREAAEVTKSAGWLREARLKEPSAIALALTAIWLRLYGLPADDVEARLAADVDRAERVGNLQALAMMLYALTADKHGARTLQV
jgi:hypothetical protein